MTRLYPQPKPKVRPERQFELVQKMIFQLAHRAKLDPIFPFEDAYGVAVTAFMKSCYDFDRGKGMRFSSWCYVKVRFALRSARQKLAGEPLVFGELKEDQIPPAPEL